MALAFLTSDADKDGALVRTLAVCCALESVGERPVVFCQGTSEPGTRARFPGKRVPLLSRANERMRREVAWEIDAVVGLSAPAVLVEDIRPNPISLPSSVRRVLLVGPTSFDELQQLRRRYGAVYSAFLLCDAPGSPTWPHSTAETASVLAWDRWHVIGPIHGIAAFPSEPDARRLQQLILDARPRQPLLPTAGSTSAPGDRRPSYHRRYFGTAVPLVIRVDDVVALDAPLHWLLELLAERRLHASLEVIPYLTDLNDACFAAIDASAALFEVAQHGYAHIPWSVEGRRYEFTPRNQAAAGQPSEEEAIAWGKRRLETLFPTRFRGGFSSPFDGLPEWLPALWERLGGVFISCLSSKPRGDSELPLVRAGVDVWHWRRNRGLEPREVVQKMRMQHREDGHAGLVLHAHRYVRRSERAQLSRLFDLLQTEGFQSVPLHQRASAARPEAQIGRSLPRLLRMFASGAIRRTRR